MSYGHGPLGQTLLEHNLLDEIHFAIHPVLVGRGGWPSVTTSGRSSSSSSPRRLRTGVVVVSYEPIRT